MVHKEVSGMKFQANIVGKRKLFYIVSVVLILAGMVSMLFQGLNLGIDFTSGNKMIVQFEQDVNIAELRNTLAENGLTGSKIQELDNGSYVLKTSELTQDMEEALLGALEAKFGALDVQFSGLIGPSIGAELKKSAAIALTLAVILMLCYITFRFELHFAIAGILALFHDVLAVVAVFSIFQLEVDSTFIAALLTVFGYSINDKIVVFDRIRENLTKVRKEELADLVNTSIAQSFTRSMNTSISTLILLLALLFFGGTTTRIFVLAMAIGVVAGTYSSLCIASPIWYDIKMKQKGNHVEAK
jgi:preprotein translocase subunit SecF